MYKNILQDSNATEGNKYFILFLSLAMILSTYQIFLPFIVTYLPISLFFSVLCLKYFKLLRDDYVIFTLFASYFLSILLSFLWSSDKGAWFGSVVYGSLFFVGYFSIKSFLSRNISFNTLNRIIYLFIVFASLNAVLVIIFRLFPEIEASFWSSGLMNFFKNPKRLANIQLFKPNVFDINKSGGVFDNGNTGAAFSLLCIGATICISASLSKLKKYSFIVLFSFAVIASGSKSAIALFLILGSLFSTTLFFNKKNAILKFFTFYTFTGLIFFALYFSTEINLLFTQSSFMSDSLKTMQYRNILWDVALQEIEKHPFLGLGYGGWVVAISPYKMMLSNQAFPPHNSLISSWIDTGFIAPLSLSLIWLICFVKLVINYFKTLGAVQLGAIYAMLAVSAMSMGDTLPLFGNPNIAFPLGVLVAYGMYYSSKTKKGIVNAQSRNF